MKKGIRKKRRLFVTAGACILLLSGCGTADKPFVTINRSPYEKLVYEITEVQKGDLEPEITLKLHAEGYEVITYDANNEELQLDNVYVSVGDHVEKGDILVSFHSESIQEIIDTYEAQAIQNQLLVEHYSKLMQLDNTLDYSQDISQLQKDITVANLYIEEAKEKLSRYQIVAKESGTIIKMDESLQNGIFKPGSSVVTEACSNGNYQAERPEGYQFQIGETYSAKLGAISYEFQISELTEDTIFFAPISDMSSVMESDILNLTIKRPLLTDVVYVDKNAVQEVNGSYFVYVQNEKGYREAVPVTVGEYVGKYQIIISGLSGGEKVTLN